MNYIAYYRVSTKDQGRSGLGLEAQERAVSDFLRRHQGELIGSFIEIESGKNNYRAELEAAKKAAIAKNATLLIAKLDRLARRASFILSLLDTPGLKIKVCDLENADRMTLSIMAVIAEKEAEMISQRTKDALVSSKSRGKQLGMHNPEIARHACAARKRAAALRKLDMWKRAAHVGPLIADMRVKGNGMRVIADVLLAHASRLPQSHPVNGVKWTLNAAYFYYKAYNFVGPQQFWADLPPSLLGNMDAGSVVERA